MRHQTFCDVTAMIADFTPAQIQNKFRCSAVFFPAFFHSCMFRIQLHPSSSGQHHKPLSEDDYSIVSSLQRGGLWQNAHVCPWCHTGCWNPTPAAGRSCAGSPCISASPGTSQQPAPGAESAQSCICWRGIRPLLLRVPHDSQMNTATVHQTLSKWFFLKHFFNFFFYEHCWRVSIRDKKSRFFSAQRRAQRTWEAQVFWTVWRALLRIATPWRGCEVAAVSASFGCSRSPRPRAGLLWSVILFSPRSLLPGQMNTNAFRSSTDKEWTRFRGSNVSGLFFFPPFLSFFFFSFNLAVFSGCFQSQSLCEVWGLLWSYGISGRNSNERNQTRNCCSFSLIAKKSEVSLNEAENPPSC